MRLAVISERVERALDRGLEVYFGRRSEHREPRRTLAIVGEQPMHISAGDLAVLRDRAVELSVGEAHERPCAIGASRLPNVHFITAERCAIGEARALDLRQRLFAGQNGRDIQQLQALDLARGSFHAVWIGPAPAQHLVAAADPENPPASPSMSEKVDIPALLPKEF